ncbi:Ultraviolet-B receptor uvr8 [Cymbomonas tetramitiformis]|uniref:Ultraviolet-B receptor uvr8 n=1 Tax=Cymbomonas tetramitiformis TaxID=36881 RepID=A0AAE0BLA2_9CHLO|nr:Ultraviolet-B receptor uvr8 [Cymbomonas tetramitiformis]
MNHGVFVTNGGAVYTVGLNNNGQLGLGNIVDRTTAEVVSALSSHTVVKASCGSYHSVFLTSGSLVFACGDGYHGQLGTGSKSDRSTPVQVLSSYGVVDIFCSSATGYGSTSSTQSTATQVMSGHTVVDVTHGAFHSVFVTSQNTVYVCGQNANYQLCSADTADQPTPQQVMSGYTVSSATANQYGSVFHLTDGRVFGPIKPAYSRANCRYVEGSPWGGGGGLRTGVGRKAGRESRVHNISGGRLWLRWLWADGLAGALYLLDVGGVEWLHRRSAAVVIEHAAGMNHGVFVTNGGAVYTVGLNNNGQLGLGNTVDRTTAEVVSALSSHTVVKASCGSYHSVFLTSGSLVFACGDGYHGQLGTGSKSDRSTPVQVLSSYGVVDIFCSSGGTGYGSTSSTQSTATQVMSGHTVVDVTHGAFHSVFVTSQNTVYVCGQNANYQLCSADTADQPTPQQVMSGYTVSSATANQYGSVFHLTDGRVFGPIKPAYSRANCRYVEGSPWGGGGGLRTGVGRKAGRESRVHNISGGRLWLRWLWADGLAGALYLLDVGGVEWLHRRSAAVVIEHAAGMNHGVFVTNGGAVYTVGLNNNGQLGLGNTVDRTTAEVVSALSSHTVVKASCGSYHSVFLTSGSLVFACGDGYHGQLGTGSKSDRSTPVQVLSSYGVVDIFCSSGGTGYGSTSSTQSTATQVMSGHTVVDVTHGAFHSVFVTSQNTVYVCGQNANYQLCSADTADQPTPQQVMSGYTVSSATANQYGSVFHLTDGRVFGPIKPAYSRANCRYVEGSPWGGGGGLRTGVGRKAGRESRVHNISGGRLWLRWLWADGLAGALYLLDVGGVEWLHRRSAAVVIEHAAGMNHGVFVTNGGAVYTVGLNNNGQLGLGNIVDRTTAEVVSALSSHTVVKASCGSYHSVFLTSGSLVFACGDGYHGQLGTGSKSDRSTPVQVLSSYGVVDIFCSSGGTGYGSTSSTQSTATQVMSGHTVVDVTHGAFHSVFVTSQNTVYVCGQNANYQLCSADTADQPTPQQVMSGYTVIW